MEANACHYADSESGGGSIAMIRDFRLRKQAQGRLAAAMETAELSRRQAEAASWLP